MDLLVRLAARAGLKSKLKFVAKIVVRLKDLLGCNPFTASGSMQFPGIYGDFVPLNEGEGNDSNLPSALVILNRDVSLNCGFIQIKQSHATSVALHLPLMAVCFLFDGIGRLFTVIGKVVSARYRVTD